MNHHAFRQFSPKCGYWTINTTLLHKTTAKSTIYYIELTVLVELSSLMLYWCRKPVEGDRQNIVVNEKGLFLDRFVHETTSFHVALMPLHISPPI